MCVCICLSLDGEYFGMVRSVRPIVSSSNEYAVTDKKFSETFQFSIKDIRMLVHIFFTKWDMPGFTRLIIPEISFLDRAYSCLV